MRALANVKHGFYIDCGAAHPVTDNVTLAFYKKGWSGINIEPDPEHFESLAKWRTNDINLNIGVGKESGALDYFQFKGTGYSTLSPVQAKVWIDQGINCTRHKVSVRSLNEIIGQFKPPQIHFVKIDVEGFEKNVLEGIDLAVTRPWIFVIEATLPNTNILADQDWRMLLETQGYERCLFDGINVYYCAKERPVIAERLKYPANCLDKFIENKHAEAHINASTLNSAIDIFRKALEYSKFRGLPAAQTRKISRLFAIPDYGKFTDAKFSGKIYFDITRLMESQVITGIERAVLNLASSLLRITRHLSLSIEFVGISKDNKLLAYRGDQAIAESELNIGHLVGHNFSPNFAEGDIWISAELNQKISSYKSIYAQIKRQKVKICSFVYDLFPLTNPEWSPPEEIQWFSSWWQTVISISDMMITDSRKVAHQVADYAQLFSPGENIAEKLRWLHLGADSLTNATTESLTQGSKYILSDFKYPTNGHPTFLTVATLHPRKGLEYLISEFNVLWSLGIKVNLIVTGISPLKNKTIQNLIQNSKYSDQFLIYAGYLSDAVLIDLYRTVDCVIYPSYDEGFGLPVLETLYEGGNVILRDNEINREIVAADDPVFWFSEQDNAPLRGTVIRFLKLARNPRNRRTTHRKFIRWDDSARALLNHISDIASPG